MKKLIALATLLILLALSSGSLVSGGDSSLPVARVGRAVAEFDPARAICGDNIWEDCENCGSDAFYATEHIDMNHDCLSNLIDVGMMNVYMVTGDVAGDLDEDSPGVVLEDFIVFLQHLNNPDPFDCTECTPVTPLGCSGSLSVSFSADPNNIVPVISGSGVPANGRIYIVAEGCADLAAFSFELVASRPQDFLVLDPTEWEEPAQYPPFGTGPHTIAVADYVLNGNYSGDPIEIDIRPHANPIGHRGLIWTSFLQPQEFEFATISHGGINGPPSPNTGCNPVPDGCRNREWEDCENCGHDAFLATGRVDMNHDCKSSLIDLAMIGVALGTNNLSGDFNHDYIVDQLDLLELISSADLPDPIEPCVPCPDELPLGCRGHIRLSFSSDPTVDLDRTSPPVLPLGHVYVVADGCNDLAAFALDLRASGGIDLLGFQGWEGEEVFLPLGPGPQIIASTSFRVDSQQPYGQIWIEPHANPSIGDRGLAWATATPPQDLEFATISHAGIDMPPPCDDGCESPGGNCGNDVWEDGDDCEFCGRDAYEDKGHADMNHDCMVELIDVGMMVVASHEQDISGDLNGDGDVNPTDFTLFTQSLNDPDPFVDCVECLVEPLGCAGRIRVSFSNDPATDHDELSGSFPLVGPVYIVAEGCDNLAAFTFSLQAEGDISVIGDPACSYGAVAPALDPGPQIIATAVYQVTNQADQGEIKIVRCLDPIGGNGLAWTSVCTPQKFEFATISHGGINRDPSSDDGCTDCNENGTSDSAEGTTVLTFCVEGSSTGALWDWGIQEPSGTGFSYVILGEGPLLPPAFGTDFAQHFVNAINTKTCGSIRAEVLDPPFTMCFEVSVPGAQGFEFGVYDNSISNWVWLGSDWIVNSANFNPTITLVEPASVPEIQAFNVQCFPNPFNPTTQVTYELPQAGHLTIKIFNPRGELVKTLIDEPVAAGVGEVPWNGTDTSGAKVAAGVYFYQAVSMGETVRGKIALVK